MRLVEFQVKRLLQQIGVKVPESTVVSAGGVDGVAVPFPVVAKAQIPAVGRAKRGGVITAASKRELSRALPSLFELRLDGFATDQVLVEEMVDTARELYLALTVDRPSRRVRLLASPEGGVEVEASQMVAAWPLTQLYGIPAYVRRQVADHLHLDAGRTAVDRLLDDLLTCMHRFGLTLLELNPLAQTAAGELVALDAKASVDPRSRSRLPSEVEVRPAGSALQQALAGLGVSAVQLEPGGAAVVASGAGAGMATLDAVTQRGGTVGAFVDLGGTAIHEQDTCTAVMEAVREREVVCVNCFFQLADCRVIARATRAACRDGTAVVVRLEGRHAAEARRLLSDVSRWVTTDFEQACRWTAELQGGDA